MIDAVPVTIFKSEVESKFKESFVDNVISPEYISIFPLLVFNRNNPLSKLISATEPTRLKEFTRIRLKVLKLSIVKS